MSNNSLFVVKTKDFYKKKWLKEHIAILVKFGLYILVLFVTGMGIRRGVGRFVIVGACLIK